MCENPHNLGGGRINYKYSETCEKATFDTDFSGWCGKVTSYKGACHVILLAAKLHDMYLYKTATFPNQPPLKVKDGSLT